MSGGKSIAILRVLPTSVSIDTKALNSVLDQVENRPFAFYSINGPKRQGKSFMLNKFLHYLQAKEKNQVHGWFELSNTDEKYFHWRGGSERNTIGINIWSKPFFTQFEGREVAILLMDTQGSFDDQTTLQQNAIVFALSALLSSVLIFNIMKDVGEDILQFLQYFSGFAKMAASGDDQNDDDSFQKLVFLIRDMEFSDYSFGYYDDCTCPPGQRLNFKHKLNPNESQPFEVKFVREQIQSSFRDIAVFALPHPGKDLARYDKQNNLDEEFQAHTKDFVTLMFSNQNIKLKSVGGIEVSGTDFKKYVLGWAKLFQSNDLPEMKSVFETAAEMQSTIAMRNALTFYEAEMKKFINMNTAGVSDEEFMSRHLDLIEKSFVVFRKMKKLGGKEYESRFGEELQEQIEPMKEIYQAVNATNRRAEMERKQFEKTQNDLRKEINENVKALENVKDMNEKDRERFQTEIKKRQKQADEIARQMAESKSMHQQEIIALKKSVTKRKKGFFGHLGAMLDSIFE